MNAPLLPAVPGYEDLQLIAHGTTALVFRATQTRLNRPVAIKMITVDTGAVPVNAERELATTVALSSQPHIVSIIDTGVTEDDRPYIVMEYCEGGSYGQILRQTGPLPVDDVIEVGIKIGEALHAAHEAGIVHRDVKPSNILRSRFGPALTDFGIARAPDELGGTLTREMMTPHHASPEALLHQAQSGPSDTYSLASTMWTLLVGHPPFVDPANPTIDMYLFRDKVLHDPLPPMSREDVPEWLAAELRRAMSKRPAQRHATASEFAEALRRGALGLSPASPEPAWPVPVVREPAIDLDAPLYRPAAPTERDRPAPSHPLGGEQAPAATVAEDEGGWLGAEPESSESLGTRRFATPDMPGGTGGRSGGLLALLVGVTVIAVACAALLMLRSNGPTTAAPPGDPLGSTSPTFITAGSTGAPTDLAIQDDRGTSVTLAFTDPTGGVAAYIAIKRPSNGEGPESQAIAPGSARRTVTFTGLNRDRNYCFAVTVVYSVTNVASTPDVCTRR